MLHLMTLERAMPTFCISDLHLCDRGPRDNFAYNGREERFDHFLKIVEQAHGRLLILGDLLDWWQVPVGAAISAVPAALGSAR